MTDQTKYRLIKLLIYVLVGFAVAFFWHQMRNRWRWGSDTVLLLILIEGYLLYSFRQTPSRGPPSPAFQPTVFANSL